MTDTPLRWGVISTAKIAAEHVIPGTQRAAGCEVVAIASRDADRAAAAAADLGIPRSYGSYEELLADPDIDAIYNPLPNHLHLPWTLAAADAGKHVLCEKPLGLTAVEAQQMVDHCRDRGVLLAEAFMYRYHPSWIKTFELVRSGAIGELTAIQASFSYYSDDPDNIRARAEWGGGATLDIGCYPVNVIRQLLGDEPKSVSAAMKIDPTLGIDILTSAILDYGDVQASFFVSMRAANTQIVLFAGTEGRLWTTLPFNASDRDEVVLYLTAAESPADPNIEEIRLPPAHQYQLQAEAFATAVRTDTPMPYPDDDAVGNMAMLERIFAAAGRTTTGGTIPPA